MNNVHVVLAAANPRGTTPLQLDDEVRRIEMQLAQSAYSAAMAGQTAGAPYIVLRAVWAAQLIDLIRNVTALLPAVIHFSGHGEGLLGLVMAAESGHPLPIKGDILRELLSEFSSTTRLVVLNACYSSVQAEEIRQVIDCVIGMQDGITDQGATIFAATLYGQLSLGSSVGRAFHIAKAILSAHVPADRDIPCLKCRDGVNPDQIFLAANNHILFEGPPWKTMLEGPAPTLSVLRQAINLALPKDVDLEAFVQDRRHDPRYARVHREWGADMQRQRKLNLLFDYGPAPHELKADLITFLG